MVPRIHLITLGVADVEASAAFYERLGFVRSAQSVAGAVAFFQVGALVLSVFGRAALAEDAGLIGAGTESGSLALGGNGGPGGGAGGFSAVTIACNVASPAEVEAVMARAIAAGARITRPPSKAFWGGYTAYFADPDGHLWEVAHNPFWSFDDTGAVRLPD